MEYTLRSSEKWVIVRLCNNCVLFRWGAVVSSNGESSSMTFHEEWWRMMAPPLIVSFYILGSVQVIFCRLYLKIWVLPQKYQSETQIHYKRWCIHFRPFFKNDYLAIIPFSVPLSNNIVLESFNVDSYLLKHIYSILVVLTTEVTEL